MVVLEVWSWAHSISLELDIQILRAHPRPADQGGGEACKLFSQAFWVILMSFLFKSKNHTGF